MSWSCPNKEEALASLSWNYIPTQPSSYAPKDWVHDTTNKAWVTRENHLFLVSLSFLLWITPASRPPETSFPLLMSETLKLWASYCHRNLLSSRPNPLIPVFHKLDFPLALNCPCFLTWQASDDPRIGSLLESGSLPTLDRASATTSYPRTS